MEKYKIRNNKRIPSEYLYNDAHTRLQLLAGLIDTDGYKSGESYEITQKRYDLICDIKILCDQLGFKTNVMEKFNKKFNKMYYRISINGYVDKIPVKLDRKKVNPKRRVDHLISSINVENIGVGDYSGVELDGDNLFLLEDCTVLHNSMISKHLINVRDAKVFNVDTEREMVASKMGLDLNKPEDNEEILKYTHGSTDPKNRTVKLLKTSLSSGKELPNIIFDTVGTHVDLIKELLNLAKSKGYTTTMIYVKCDLETALQRNRQRERTLSDEVVKDYHNRVAKTFDVLFPLYDDAWVVDNSGEMDLVKRRDIAHKLK